MRRRDFLGMTVGLAGAALAPGVGAQAPAAAGPVTPDTVAAGALRRFMEEGRTCAEAIVMTGCSAMGIEDERVPDFALGLAGGVGLQGLTCGAITGAAIVLGLVNTRQPAERPQQIMATARAVQTLTREFAEQFGATDCRTLTGLDLTTPEGRRELKERVKPQVCRGLIEWAARRMAELAIEGAADWQV